MSSLSTAVWGGALGARAPRPASFGARPLQLLPPASRRPPRPLPAPPAAFAAPSLPAPLRDLSARPPDSAPRPLPRATEGPADDPRLRNPLQRLERLGTGWFGVILELEVCLEECGDSGRSWQALAAEEGKSPPLQWALRKAEGMKNEQV